MNITPNATHVSWPTDIGNGYNIKANVPYEIKYNGSRPYIAVKQGFLRVDEIYLLDGEITQDVWDRAVFT